MKIEVYAICYNEEALLPYFLRHYSTFADSIMIFDNYSTDKSQEICRRNPKVSITLYESGNEIRDDIYLQIKNNCWKGSDADWVIICDIDELVYHPDMREMLGQVKSTIMTPQMFNMYSDKFPTTAGQIYEEVILGIACGSKTNLFRPDSIVNINYDPGCHVAHPEGNLVWDHIMYLKTLHMRNLGKQWLIERNENSRKRLSEINKKLGWGVHYLQSADDLSRQFDEEYKQATPVL